MNSGLYLVLLLHLYEQRFAELMRLNYNRVARERVSLALTCPIQPHFPKLCRVVDYMCNLLRSSWSCGPVIARMQM